MTAEMSEKIVTGEKEYKKKSKTKINKRIEKGRPPPLDRMAQLVKAGPVAPDIYGLPTTEP